MNIDIAAFTDLAPPILLLVGLGLSVAADPYIRRDHRRVMFMVIGLVLSLLAQNYVEYLLTHGRPRIELRTAVAIYGYIVRPVIILLFYYFVGNGKKHGPAWIIAGVNAVIYLTAFFSPLTFRITAANTFSRGPLGFSCHVVTGILLFNLLCMTIHEYGRDGKVAGIPLLSSVLIVVSVALDSSLFSDPRPITALTTSVVICCVFYYIWLHLQFVRLHEQDLMAEQRIRIMVSQIQPHFLYNTIATIRALCKRDPDRAAEMAEKFGMYLRQNIDSLGSEGLIPVEKELEHTRLYAEIEMVRFENVHVEYDIGDRGFALPPLTIQPIVENAIRHGVRVRENGIVRVTTRLADGYHEIVIEDNGIGFDTQAIESADKSHIGVRNVRERIERLCGGTMTMESVIDQGTTMTIRIPAGGAER